MVRRSRPYETNMKRCRRTGTSGVDVAVSRDVCDDERGEYSK